MATRLYLVATTAPSATPTPDAGWPDTSQMARRTLALAQAATTETRSGTLTGAAGNTTLIAQLHTPPLSGAQSISGSISAITRGRELAATDNINTRPRAARVYTAAGALRGTLMAYSLPASTTELSTALSGQANALTSGITTVAAQDGDYIVVELGYGETVSGTTPNWEMVLGGTGTDHGTGNNDVTGTVPWVEFSANLVFQTGSSVNLTPATLAVTAQPLTPVPGLVSVSLTPAALALVAAPLTATPGPVTVTLTPAAMALTAIAVTPVPIPVTVALTPAVLTLTAQPLSPVGIAPGLAPAVLTLTAVPLNPVPGAVTVTLTPVPLALTARALTPTPGAVAVSLTPALLAFAAAPLQPVGLAPYEPITVSLDGATTAGSQDGHTTSTGHHHGALTAATTEGATTSGGHDGSATISGAIG